MIVEGKLWSEVYSNFNFGGNLTSEFTEYFKFSGDTTFNEKSYKVLFSCYADSTLKNWRIAGFWREDSMKIYEYRHNLEYTRYDFGLEKGDTFCIDFPIDPCWGDITVDSVDTVSINGSLRKRLIFNRNDIWIEGIGSRLHPFQPLVELIDAGQALLCCKQNDILLYQNEYFTDCYVFYITDIISPESDLIEILIYPNPFKNSCTISINGIIPSEIKTINLLSSQGQIIRNINKLSNTITLDRINLLPGIYFIQVIDRNNNILVKKVIVK
jgi:hypothetical protein